MRTGQGDIKMAKSDAQKALVCFEKAGDTVEVAGSTASAET